MQALITGVNSYVNKVLMTRLLDMGYEVTAHYHRDNNLTEQLKVLYPNVRFLQADFTDKKSFSHFVKQAMDRKYDVLVNAAVYYAEANDWKPQQSWDEWEKTFAVNTAVPGLLMAHAATELNKGGVIINISSTMGKVYMADLQFTMYSASKAALDSLTMAYAKRWSPDLRVVGIAPGWIKSKWNKDMPEKEVEKMIGPQLTRKFVEPEEIADLMEVAIKNKSINATTLLIDGGLGAPIV